MKNKEMLLLSSFIYVMILIAYFVIIHNYFDIKRFIENTFFKHRTNRDKLVNSFWENLTTKEVNKKTKLKIYNLYQNSSFNEQQDLIKAIRLYYRLEDKDLLYTDENTLEKFIKKILKKC